MVDFNKLNAKAHQKRAAEISAHVMVLRQDLQEYGLFMLYHQYINQVLRIITGDRAAATHYKRARELMGIE